MITESVLLQNLCAPCACRCRYCLLSWDGKPVGVPWERGAEFALRFSDWMGKNLPELKFCFSYGYSMEHTDIRAALALLRRIGSPQAEYWQCDGMRMRSEAECRALAELLKAEGVKHLNFTFYGLEEYHDRFAAREGDHALMLRMIRAAAACGLRVSVGVPLTRESAPQADELITLLTEAGCEDIRLFVPHEEGRGRLISGIRLRESDLELLSEGALARMNRSIYRPEREWARGGAYEPEARRSILISLRGDNIDAYENTDPGEIIKEVEELDEKYYSAFPPFEELAERYGDPMGTEFYKQRDIYHHYRRMYQAEFGLELYDVTDERQSGSRRY